MLVTSNVTMQFGSKPLFENISVKFGGGNRYGLIGANGSGKSTFMKILGGDLEPTLGNVSLDPNERIGKLRQDQFAFEEFTVLDTVIMGHAELWEVKQERDRIYALAEMSEEDGYKVADLEVLYGEMDGYSAEARAGELLLGVGIPVEQHYGPMSEVAPGWKLRVLLAQALFGNPGIILLDEPTNHLDVKAIAWLEDFLMEYPGTVLVVSHDRHFLNTVCTNIVDVDYGKIKMYVGNYEFWYESSQLVQRMIKDQNKKNEEKIKELQAFIQRFSANKSKSKQATSRRKLLDKLSVEEMPASSRRYPFVGFKMDREPGKEILQVEGISKTIDGVKVLDNVSFRVNNGDKIAFVGENEIANTTLFKIIMGELEPDEGSYKWGVTIATSYFPLDNSDFFNDCDLNLVAWLSQYSQDTSETFLRGFLGKMLFSGDEVYKPVKVLSGGEKVRCMLSRMMLFGSNMLVLDQPTNHLDLESITAVNEGLIAFQGGVLFASHDHEFIQTIANRIIEIQPDGSIVDKLCSYDEYIGEA